MRSTLLSSLIPCVQYNINRQQSRVRFFELGLRFDYQDASNIHDLKQIPTLAMIAVGAKQAESWHGKPQAMDFFDFKGEVEEVLAAGRVQVEYVRSERAWLHPGQSAEIMVAGQSIGYLGRLHPTLEAELDLGTTNGEIDFQDRYSSILSAEPNKVNITVPGRFDYTVGKKVYLKL